MAPSTPVTVTIGSKLFVALIDDLAVRRLADLADQILFTGHRLRLLAGLGQPLRNVLLQSVFGDRGYIVRTELKLQPASTQQSVPAAATTAVDERMKASCYLLSLQLS